LTEAELEALDEAIRQAFWLRNFLTELTYPQSKPTVIYVDSKSSIAISESLKTGSNVGHMMMRINCIYQEVLAKTIEVKYINTYNQVADILTKPLALEQYAVLSDILLRGFNGVPVTR
jgi:hypothetical protein